MVHLRLIVPLTLSKKTFPSFTCWYKYTPSRSLSSKHTPINLVIYEYPIQLSSTYLISQSKMLVRQMLKVFSFMVIAVHFFQNEWRYFYKWEYITSKTYHDNLLPLLFWPSQSMYDACLAVDMCAFQAVFYSPNVRLAKSNAWYAHGTTVFACQSWSHLSSV